MKIKWGIVIILLTALFLRVYRLGNLPVALFGDEVDAGYQAWSLATTLRDYHGHFLPTYIQSLSEWRAPLEMYVVAPFVGLLGSSDFAARLPMALLGVLSIYLTYLILNRLYPKTKTGLVAAAIMALTPWHLHYTRNVVEQPPLFVLMLLGVYFYLRGKERSSFYLWSFFAFILTFYTYSIANLATPIIVLLLFFCFPPDLNLLKKKSFLFGLTVCFLAVIPIAYQILLGPAAGRFRLINISSDKLTIDQIFSDRNRPWLKSVALERLYNNNFTAFGSEFMNNYLISMSPQFLFISGDPNYRQSVDRFGVFLIVFAPAFLWGLMSLLRETKNRNYLFLLGWFFLIPLGSSLTQGGGNHASRLFLQNFSVSAIIAVGLIGLISLVKSKYRSAISIFVILLVIFDFSAYWYRYTTHYAYESSHVWQYGYEPLFSQSRALVASAKRVFINNTAEPALYRFAFYASITPADFQKDFTTDIPRDNLLPGFSGFRFGDKYYFGTAGNLDGIAKLLQPGDIYFAAQKTDVPGDWDLEKSPPFGIKVLLTIRDFYARPLFYVLGK